MLTRCPQCTTTFRVAVATLRAAHGQVRCGRCRHRFDAIQHLIDDASTSPATIAATDSVRAPPTEFVIDADDEPRSLTDRDLARIFVNEREWQDRWGGAPIDPSAPLDLNFDEAEILVEEPAGLEEITMEGRRIEVSGTYATVEERDEESVSGPSLEIVLGEEQDGELLPPLPPDEIRLPDDYRRAEGFELKFTEEPELARLVAERPELEPEIGLPSGAEGTIAALGGIVPPTTIGTGVAITRPATPAEPRQTPVPSRNRTDEADFDELDEFEVAEQERRSRTGLMSALSLLLAVVLLLQLVHHNRQELVRHPRFGPLLGETYTWLGLPLSPNWDPTGYEVQQWGIATVPGSTSTLRVRASVTNRAGFPQPYPLLRLSLEDLWGAEVGVRALEPAEYLPPGTSPERMMAPGQRTDAEVRIVDPGEDAVGFRIDVCVRDRGALRCSGAERSATS